MNRKSGMKRVWFSEGSNKYHTLQYYEDKEDILRWYSRQDIMRFSLDIRLSVLTILSKQQGLEEQDREKVAFDHVFSRIFFACRDERLPPELDFQRYISWNKFSADLRGIERYCAGDLKSYLRKDKNRITKDLLLLQEKLKKQGVGPEMSNEFLRFAYKKDVNVYRILARIQGIVDGTLISQCRNDDFSARKNQKVAQSHIKSYLMENTAYRRGSINNKKPRHADHPICNQNLDFHDCIID
jgi:hypothetical protein